MALGDARPDNTSAIIALQRAAATPNELTRQNLYQSIEELGAIYLDFMAGYYGVRAVEVDPARGGARRAARLRRRRAAAERGGTLVAAIRLCQLRDIPMLLKLEAGASAYWSEIASAQTLDNLLAAGQIGLSRVSRAHPGRVRDRQGGPYKAVKARQARADEAA